MVRLTSSGANRSVPGCRSWPGRDGCLDEGYRALHAHVGDSVAVVLERAQRAMSQMAVHADRL
ncbi:hypothetical protein [Kitasatospora cathayae]|uniref:Uncharacterized protein n=1 Tax=Kitasatospora cathayae TaxID=3004092 RepID=A0ABY7PW99_9ACTN|nr:hypothetical protein [Kitasatospora sp. HUAS 3-15]WBP84694.1 hypothetical protein O1G21_01725 [Kitasatospora sp. HUAS 3-15]